MAEAPVQGRNPSRPLAAGGLQRHQGRAPALLAWRQQTSTDEAASSRLWEVKCPHVLPLSGPDLADRFKGVSMGSQGVSEGGGWRGEESSS